MIWLKLMAVSLKWMKLENISDHLLMPALLDSESTVIDIGGNIGEFASAIKKRFGSIIYIAEPDPLNFEKIPVQPGIHKFNIAISDKNDEISFFVSNNPQACSFNEKIAMQWGISNTIKVDTLTLKDFLYQNNIVKADLVKIDAEGSEIEIFKSIDDSGLFQVTQFTVEFHDFLDESLHQPTLEIIKRMKGLGFAVIITSRNTFSHVLFLNRKQIRKSIGFRAGYLLHSIIRKKAV